MKTATLVCGSLLLILAVSADACAERRVTSDASNDLQVHDVVFNYTQGGDGNILTTIGSIKNTSNETADELVVEVKFYDDSKQLVDVVTEPLYGIVIPPGQDVSFRVRDTADKPKASYTSLVARIASAERRSTDNQTKNNYLSIFTNILVSWGPMLLLIAVWLVLIRRFTKKGSPQRRSVELIEKQTEILARQLEVLERLTAAVEKATSKT